MLSLHVRVGYSCEGASFIQIQMTDYIDLHHMGDISQDSLAFIYMLVPFGGSVWAFFFLLSQDLSQPISLPAIWFGPPKLKSALFLWVQL